MCKASKTYLINTFIASHAISDIITVASTGIAVSLLLREDTSQAYDFDVNSEMVIVDPTPDTDLPTFRTVATPTISSFANVGDLNNDGTFLSSVKVNICINTAIVIIVANPSMSR